MIETRSPGPILLHSYLNPRPNQRPQSRHTTGHENGRQIAEQVRQDQVPLSGTSVGDSSSSRKGDEVMRNGVDYGKDLEGENGDSPSEESSLYQPPLLVASVIVGSSREAGEARRAAARLEKMGRDFQAEWTKEQEGPLEDVTTSEDG